MGIKSLVQVAVTLDILAVSTGRLPLILKEVRKAQLGSRIFEPQRLAESRTA